MRGAPQVGFSATMRKMRLRSSLLVGFLPTTECLRESHFQYTSNPARCRRTTVSGSTMISACFQPDHKQCKVTQKNQSGGVIRSLGRRRFRTCSCCRNARFSNTRSVRGRKQTQVRLKGLVKGRTWCHYMLESVTRSTRAEFWRCTIITHRFPYGIIGILRRRRIGDEEDTSVLRTHLCPNCA